MRNRTVRANTDNKVLFKFPIFWQHCDRIHKVHLIL